MKLYSTNNRNNIVSLKEALLKGLPDDNGLFMPLEIPMLQNEFIENLSDFSFQEIGFEICRTLFQAYIPENDLRTIVNNAINFPAPLITLNSQTFVLELFHGPSLAFKDFGARFMAQLMGYFRDKNDSDLVILVATSGDTGGAVAAGFHMIPGIKVVVLYPSGKVSNLQEKQLTTLGENITALEVQGTFDDCQALVKSAFLDKEICTKVSLSSANSINIGRLIPQSFYYFEGYKQLTEQTKDVSFCIPSGNFGNLTAGLFAKQMGLPFKHLIAATNINNIVPFYLKTGVFKPRPSIRTLSNAMDVGNPSNFARMDDFFGSTWNNFLKTIKGYYFNDKDTLKGMIEVQQKFNYQLDPHGAIGYLASKSYSKENPATNTIIFETAHPSKFNDEIKDQINYTIKIPERLQILKDRKKEATLITNQYSDFKKWINQNLIN